MSSMGTTSRTVMVLLCGAMPIAVPAAAQQAPPTITYTYDSRGHLQKVEQAAGRNDGVVVTVATDATDNRTQRTVTGRSRPRIIVLPLNGFTIIPLP